MKGRGTKSGGKYMSCRVKGRRQGNEGEREGTEVGLPSSACPMRSAGPNKVVTTNKAHLTTLRFKAPCAL